MLSIARILQVALKEDCQKNTASVCFLQISEIIQTWNEDDDLTQTMKDLVEDVADPKIQQYDRIC